MNLLQSIHPAKPLKYLKWFDIFIVTVLMFGGFIICSTQQFMASLSPSTLTNFAETRTNVASDWACLRSILLFLVQVCSQEFTPILYHACSCRYIWFKSLVSLNCLGNLRIKDWKFEKTKFSTKVQ